MIAGAAKRLMPARFKKARRVDESEVRIVLSSLKNGPEVFGKVALRFYCSGATTQPRGQLKL